MRASIENGPYLEGFKARNLSGGFALSPSPAYGPWLDVMAPGVSIRTTSGASGYASATGTSFSTPLVANGMVYTLGTSAVLSAFDEKTGAVKWRKDAPGGAKVHVLPQPVHELEEPPAGLSDAEIESYLVAEQPYDCAGSARSEGLGIALLEAIDSDDPTALVGLPLIRTCRMLRAAGLRVF